MEHLAMVRDGSTGELHQGYWLCDVTAAEVNSSQIVPLYQTLFSVQAEEFSSKPDGGGLDAEVHRRTWDLGH